MIQVARFFYNLFFPIVLLLLLPGFLIRMTRRGNYRHKFGQRFGIYSARVREKLVSTNRVWIHAVSVGEVNIALKLIQSLRDADPELAFVLSTTTSTGFKLALSRKSAWLEPIYGPLDFYPIVRRVVRLIRPRCLILVEAEVWPNLVCEVRRSGAKTALVNARLSPRSEKRYRAVSWITAPIFNQLDLLCLQEPCDADRWKSLGLDPAKLVLTGSIKFDDGATAHRTARDFRPVLDEIGVSVDAPILLGGSTFEGEELILANVFKELRKSHPNLFLILVPRHHERADSVARQLEQAGLVVMRRTKHFSEGKPDVLLVDTTGELAGWYLCATVVFVGKSLCAQGGQNPAEPIAAGVPVIFGPHMQNFSTLVRAFLHKGGAMEVKDATGIRNAVTDLLASSNLRADMVANAAKCLEIHRGATKKTTDLLQSRILL
jgi:3-deoxy-D-manno-octulosonic-acid transferase